MGTAVVYLLVLVAALAIGIGIGLYWVRRRNSTATSSVSQNLQQVRRGDPTELALLKLRVGSKFRFRGHDWIVRERIDYDEDGFTWFEVLAANGISDQWIEIESDDTFMMTIWDGVDSSDVVDSGSKSSVTFKGRALKQTESGRVKFSTSSQATGLPKSGFVKYRTFGGGELSADQWTSDTWEYAAGTAVESREFKVIG